MGCYCYLRNIQDLLSERRFGEPFQGPIIPFGAMVEDLSRLHQFGPKVLPGIFLGYVLSAGRIWKGDITVADLEELEKMDASEIHAKRLNAKEVLTPKKSEKCIFPVADGPVKLSGGDRSENVHLNPGQPRPRRRTRKSSRRLKRVFFQPHLKAHRRLMVKLEMISGPFQAILFTVITWNPESNSTCREKNHYLFF